MSAYLLFQVKITGQEQFGEYATLARATLENFGAKVLASGANPVTAEGL